MLIYCYFCNYLQSVCCPIPLDLFVVVGGVLGDGAAIVGAAVVAVVVAAVTFAVIALIFLEGPSTAGGSAFPSRVIVTCVSRCWPSTSTTTWKLSPGSPVRLSAPSCSVCGFPPIVTVACSGETGTFTVSVVTGETVGSVDDEVGVTASTEFSMDSRACRSV